MIRVVRAPAGRLVAAVLAFLFVIDAAASATARRASARPAVPSAQGLTQAAGLVRTYGLILDARFDEADRAVRQGCEGALPLPCQVLGTAALWWRIQMDPGNRSLDQTLRSAVDQTIAGADAWTVREPRRGEAWFYLGAAYAVRVQLRALRGERLAAARDGKRIKEALERALALDPGLDDAYFGIGMYHYLADVAPAALKFLRILLLLPGGNRQQGLAEMLQARDRGALLRGEAAYQLHLMFLWYESQPERAVMLLRELRARYPHNPLFLVRLAEVQDAYFHNAAESLAAYDTLLADARAGRVGLPALAEGWARLGAAAQLEQLAETDRAIELLKPLVDARATVPYGAAARAALGLGRAHDRLGDRARAVAAYTLAVTMAPRDDPDNVRASANDQLRRTPDPVRAEAYRLSLEGWRLVERGAWAPAIAALQRSVDRNGADPVAHYRFGRALAGRDAGDARALAEFETTIRTRPVPDAILAAAHLEAGRTLETRGDRSRALEMYHAASRVRGADGRTRDAAAKAIARLRPPLADARF